MVEEKINPKGSPNLRKLRKLRIFVYLYYGWIGMNGNGIWININGKGRVGKG